MSGLMDAYDPWAWRSNMDAPQPSKLAQALLKPGPEPTGTEKVFDSIYGWLGGLPQNRWAASKLTDLATLGGFAPWVGAYEGGKDLVRTGHPGTLAMALMPGARVAGPVAKVAEKAAEKGIRAFHGSPHSFDRFSLDKIGTGEGAQAYGHGLYFAENEGVARAYRDNLEQAAAWRKPVAHDKAVLRDIEQKLVDAAPSGLFGRWKIDKAERARLEAQAIELRDSIARAERHLNDPAKKGHMYEVNIKASPDDFLDWDKPLSQQSEKVRAAFPAEFHAQRGADAHDMLAERLAPALPDNADNGWTSIVNTMNDRVQRRDLAADALRKAGIPGIRYLDQGSRSAGEGSRNYVVFDDALIEIMRKYGLLPPAVALGAGLLSDDPAQASP